MSAAFEEALKVGDLEAIRLCPKSDLHNHGALSGDREFMLQRTGFDIAPLDRKLHSMEEMHAWVQANVDPAFAGNNEGTLGFEAALALARRDGVTRLELGYDVWTISQGRSADELTKTLQRLVRVKTPAIEWVPLISMSRHCSINSLTKWLAPFLELGAYRTFDLSGDEFAQPIEAFRPLYRMAKDHGLRLKAHVGEWGTADDVWRAVEELELNEVQHGIAAADSPAVMRSLAENGIRLNICPTSNVMLGRVERLDMHPIRKLYDAGVKVTVNTDDALVFGKSVSEEFLGLYRAGVFSAAELDQIRLNGLHDE